MVTIHLANGNFEVNEELIPSVMTVVSALGLTCIEDLVALPRSNFSQFLHLC